MKVRFSHLILLLILPALLGAGAPTSDSSTFKTIKLQPKKINPKYNAQISISNTPSPGRLMFDQSGIPYPPCPGDPNNPNWPTKVPLCPDINGKPNPGVPPFVNPSSSTYLTIAGMAQYYYPPTTVYCPDICVVTRQTTPDAPQSEITAPVPVQSFEDATCPAGYAEVGDFNVQPGIANIPIEQKVYGPFTLSDLNAYKNNSAFECSIKVDTLAFDIDILPVMYDPNDDGKYNFDKSRKNKADGENYHCSDGSGSEQTIASDTPPTYGLTGAIYDASNKTCTNCAGQWVSAWTWSPFYENPTKLNDLGHVTLWILNTSFTAVLDDDCQGPGNHTPSITAGVVHKDIYWHYYRWERCRPKQPNGWFFVNSYAPVSHTCARVKPSWQDSNP